MGIRPDDLKPISADYFHDLLKKVTEMVKGMAAAMPDEDFAPFSVNHQYLIQPDHTYTTALHVALFSEFDPELRREIIYALGLSMALEMKMVDAFFFICVAWFSATPIEQNMPYERASLDPNHSEVLMVAGMTAQRIPGLGIVACTRDDKNILVPGEITLFRQGAGEDDATFMVPGICEPFFLGFDEGARAVLHKVQRAAAQKGNGKH